jgi:hypothetical protein
MSKLLKDNMDSIDFDDIMTISLLEKRMYYFIGESFDEEKALINEGIFKKTLYKLGYYDKIDIDRGFTKRENWRMKIVPCMRIFFNHTHKTIYIFNDGDTKIKLDRTLRRYNINYEDGISRRKIKNIFKEISSVHSYKHLFYYTDQSFREIKEFILRKLSA